MPLKVQKTESNGLTFSDPANPNLTVRFKFSSSRKVLDGLPFTNQVVEVIYNDDNVITVGNESATDAVSLRLRTSCAIESGAHLSTLLHSLADQIMTWDGESVFAGFPPATAPLYPPV